MPLQLKRLFINLIYFKVAEFLASMLTFFYFKTSLEITNF